MKKNEEYLGSKDVAWILDLSPDDVVELARIIYHPQRGWYEEAPPRGALSFGRSPEEPLLPEEGPARARLS